MKIQKSVHNSNNSLAKLFHAFRRGANLLGAGGSHGSPANERNRISITAEERVVQGHGGVQVRCNGQRLDAGSRGHEAGEDEEGGRGGDQLHVVLRVCCLLFVVEFVLVDHFVKQECASVKL